MKCAIISTRMSSADENTLTRALPQLARFRLVLFRYGTNPRSLLGLAGQMWHKAVNIDTYDVESPRFQEWTSLRWGLSVHNKNDRQDRKRDSRSDD